LIFGLFADYVQMLRWYFLTKYILVGLSGGIAALLSSFFVFSASRDHRLKSSSLIAMMGMSTSLWVFVLSSFAFCFATFSSYSVDPGRAVMTSASLALFTCILLGPIAFLVLRERAINQIFPFFFTRIANDSNDMVSSRASSAFSKVLSRAGINAEFSIHPSETSFPASAALDWRGRRIVTISKGTLELLDDDELEAVLAHEVGHIVEHDSLKKTIVTAYRCAFLFDPLSRLLEAALYREREYSADEFSARTTGKPAFLASALVKIYESSHNCAGIKSSFAISSLIRTGEWGILSKEPRLATRVKKLLEMTNES
jgi:Zn-dependent protease with chaperone function